MEIATTGCTAHSHPEFRVEVDTDQVPEGYARGFMGGVQKMVAAGSRFAAGQTMQVGWSLAQVGELAGGELTLLEPDLLTLPIAYQPGLTEVLSQLLTQSAVLDSFGIARTELTFPAVNQSVVACTRFHETEVMLLQRETPTEDHSSGWLFACTDPAHDHDGAEVELISLYEAALRTRRFIPWLALPHKHSIKVLLPSAGLPRLQEAGEEVVVVPGSFVATAYA